MGRQKTEKRSRKKSRADRADAHALYEAAVQCAETEIDFIDAEFTRLRDRTAHYLREDFCGTANAACEWVRRRQGNYATAIDLEPSVLAWGQEHHVLELGAAEQARVALVNADVMSVDTPLQDIIIAMNFSYWVFKERRLLRRYFKRLRDSLVDDGVAFLDCYGGYDAFRVLKERTQHKRFTYVWDQASYNPVNGDLTCHIHFHFPDGSRMKRAFSYDWRLWTLPEIREVLTEAGFQRSVVYWQGWDEETESGNGEFSAVETADADAGWICYLAALK